jgi:hypothetical protein
VSVYRIRPAELPLPHGPVEGFTPHPLAPSPRGERGDGGGLGQEWPGNTEAMPAMHGRCTGAGGLKVAEWCGV